MNDLTRVLDDLVADAPVDRADWSDVQARRRVRRGTPRRQRRIALAFAVLAALAVPTALAVRERIIDFGSSEPAPTRIVREFEHLNRRALPMRPLGVVAGETRKVIEVRGAGGRRYVLWVAPTRRGGWCEQLQLFVAGRSRLQVGVCGGREGGRMHAGAPIWLMSRTGEIRGALAVHGRVRDRSIVRLELVHEDGARVEIPFVWVSDPIGIGFFVHAVPRERWNARRPTEVVAFDDDGRVVKREPVRLR